MALAGRWCIFGAGGGPVDRSVPRPPALDGTSWGSVQVEMNSGGN